MELDIDLFAVDTLLLIHFSDYRYFFLLQTLVFCTGQIYYELLAEREKRGRTDVAICTLEQIAPFPFDKAARYCQKYSNAELVWAQQEPK